VTPVQSPAAVGWWVYGVVDAAAEAPKAPGVGAGVDLVRCGGVAALVARVDLGEFGEAAAKANLEDPAWLEAKARAHEEVLEEALASGDAVVPFRFLTVYSDEADLRQFLADHASELADVLDRVRGTVEIGVKAFVDRERLDRAVSVSSPAVAGLDAQIAAATTGRAYLLERRRDQLAREEASRVLASFASSAHERLAAIAIAATVSPVQPAQLSGRPEQMILNGAYLVRTDDDALSRELADVSRDGLELGIAVEPTGPWPPYNFVPRDLGVA
jgi:hypothetical protein